MKPFDGHALKLIALLSMLIDHLGAVFFPQYRFLRYIGRLAFPIFCFLLTEGYIHTRSRKRQLATLLIFAAISEIPFDLAFFSRPVNNGHQNVFFTLALAYFSMIAYDFSVKNIKNAVGGRIVGIISVFLIMLIAELLNTDYGAMGVALVFVFYMLKGRPLILFIAVALLNATGFPQFFATLSYPLVLGYNGRRGRQLKWLFYIIYPLHLTIYALIAGLIGIHHYDFGLFAS